MASRRGRRVGRPAAATTDVPPDDVILAKGLQAFGELGYDGASVRELARWIGVSHNFINDRYGSKEAFWRAVVDRAQQRLWATVRAAMEDPSRSELDRFRGAVRAFCAAHAEEPHLAAIMNDEARRDTPRLHYVLDRYIRTVLADVAPRVERLKASGQLRDVPLDAVVFSIVATVQAASQQPLLALIGDSYERDGPGFLETLADIVLDGLVRPPTPSSAQTSPHPSKGAGPGIRRRGSGGAGGW
jgi:TetR/AcrR family transcriptional regulator